MANWLTTRGAVMRAAQIEGSNLAPRVDAAIAAASVYVEQELRTNILPLTATRNYRWPKQRSALSGTVLMLDAPLLAATSVTKDGDTVTAIAAADYYLEPANEGPPYWWIEIDQSSSAFFDTGLTPQRAVRVTGRWGEDETTAAAGNLNGAIGTTSATSISLTRGDVADVGSTLLVGSEQLFVSDRTDEDISQNLGADIAATKSVKTVTLGGAPTDAVRVGEVLRIASERMRVEAVNTTTSFEVERSYAGTTIAAHSSGADVYVERTYTVVRGVNGTTAATASDDAAVTVYAIPADIEQWARAEAIALLLQDRSGWGREVGTGEGQREFRGNELARYRKTVMQRRGRRLVASL